VLVLKDRALATDGVTLPDIRIDLNALRFVKSTFAWAEIVLASISSHENVFIGKKKLEPSQIIVAVVLGDIIYVSAPLIVSLALGSTTTAEVLSFITSIFQLEPKVVAAVRLRVAPAVNLMVDPPSARTAV